MHQQFGTIIDPFGIMYPPVYKDMGCLTKDNGVRERLRNRD